MNGPPKMVLPEWNDPADAFILDRSDEAFGGVGIRIRRLIRRLHDVDSGIMQAFATGAVGGGVSDSGVSFAKTAA